MGIILERIMDFEEKSAKIVVHFLQLLLNTMSMNVITLSPMVCF